MGCRNGLLVVEFCAVGSLNSPIISSDQTVVQVSTRLNLSRNSVAHRDAHVWGFVGSVRLLESVRLVVVFAASIIVWV